jgi:hypothetical protein
VKLLVGGGVAVVHQREVEAPEPPAFDPKLPPSIVAARIGIGMIVKIRKAVARRLRLRSG